MSTLFSDAANDRHTAAIALGSNLSSSFGTPQQTVRAAIERLATLGRVAAVSTLRVTAPEIFLDQPQFVNGALLLETPLSPLDLLRSLLTIEADMGRVRTGIPPKGPRTIDLDLIFYDTTILISDELTLPHPALAERRFVLEPLAEITPGWRHPLTGMTVAAMLAHLREPGTELA